MALRFREYAICKPSQQSDAYITTIVPTISDGLAAITSANELILVNRANLQAGEVLCFSNVPAALTCLVVASDGSRVTCASSDGTVATFDVRSRARVAQFNVGRPMDHSYRVRYRPDTMQASQSLH